MECAWVLLGVMLLCLIAASIPSDKHTIAFTKKEMQDFLILCGLGHVEQPDEVFDNVFKGMVMDLAKRQGLAKKVESDK